ncbi:MAG: NADH-quinone oxidoreductase subunit C [Burkholderiales bacterium]
MGLEQLNLAVAAQAGPLPIWRAAVDAERWRSLAAQLAAADCRLVSLWGSDGAGSTDGAHVNAAYALPEGLLWVDLALGAAAAYPDIAAHFPCAARMQRATADLLGLRAEGASDFRPWLDHGVWREQQPLRRSREGLAAREPATHSDYEFVQVEGDGVHEIPVGPVHAGIIEPGHFRFSIVGEKVLRLEERLGYVHKGIERRFTELSPLEAHRLAGRVSGDSAVAFGWAYCMALESALGITVPARAAWLRALMLERERVANHLGDLGAIGNDAALAFGLAQFSRLREDWQRESMLTFGHRLMMDAIVPGGTACDVDSAAIVRTHALCERVKSQVLTLRTIYDEHAGLQDRLIGTGCVAPELARRLGLTGLAGRSSGQASDLRCDHAWPPYDGLQVVRATSNQGDVAARVAVRFDEVIESLRLICALVTTLPTGTVRVEPTPLAGSACGAGWVEGWRGEVFVALELHAGAIARCHCHDPSWQNWPLLQHAVIGNIVPDFPLINKSFNLSYSGQDL